MIEILGLTGKYLHQHADGKVSSNPELAILNSKFFERFEDIIQKEHTTNQWFTPDSIRSAIGAISFMLAPSKLNDWLRKYPSLPAESASQKTVGVVMAGNIPLVGFHDFLSVIISGHRFFGKPSSKDDKLIRIIADILVEQDPSLSDRIMFSDGYLKNADAQIATGSNNSSRYFDYYFKDIPHIIRRNRSSVAIISGDESRDELLELGKDIFTYFGLGCRSVTKVYIPEDYDITVLLEALEDFKELSNHNKYANNIDYQRSVYLMNRVVFLDNVASLFRENSEISSPVGVVFYEKYSELNVVREELVKRKEDIQCIVTNEKGFYDSVLPGQAQSPELWDYADGIDTLQFLTDIAS
jgi:hypothetical protein